MKSKRVKIVYLINGLGPGGAEMMLYRLLERIDRDRYEPVVVALLNIEGTVEEKIKELGINVYVLGVRSKFNLMAIFRLYRLLKELNPDVIQTRLFAADLAGRVLGRLLKVPYVITEIRNVYYGGFGRYLLFKLTEPLADMTLFVSYTAARRFEALKIVPSGKARVIYSGLDPEEFPVPSAQEDKKRRRAEQGLPDEEQLLLAVGSLTAQKGYSTLFQAIKDMHANFDYHLLIAGSGPLAEELQAEVRELGLFEKVTFLGRSDRVPELMAAADLLVLSSKWEGLPGVVIEAMACALPVVATAVGGTPELVEEGQTGWLVPPNDPEALKRALEKVLCLSDEERLQWGLAGRVRVERYFHVDKMVAGYEDIYRELLVNKD